MPTTPSTTTFFDFHKPVLADGTYTATVTQTLTTAGTAVPSPQAASVTFEVSTPRFQLDQSLVQTVYPPVGGKGDYRAVLPSLVLTRSTLPWERSPGSGLLAPANSGSWLFLLVIAEADTAAVTEQNNSTLGTLPPAFNIPAGETADQLNYLEVSASLQDLFPPTLSDLQYLSFTRQKDAGTAAAHEEHALIIANRLPVPGTTSTVYLVSLENTYAGIDGTATFTGIKNGSGDFVLPYFYKWNFFSDDEQYYALSDAAVASIDLSFKNAGYSPVTLTPMLDTLYQSSQDFVAALGQLTPPVNQVGQVGIIKKIAKLPGTTFYEMLVNLNGGFAAMNSGPAAAGILSSGTVALDYNQVAQNASGVEVPTHTTGWYRSPLAAGPVNLSGVSTKAVAIGSGLVPQNAAGLLLTNGSTRDLTYAAAYQLGQLTALNDVTFATAFYQWKNTVATAARTATLTAASGKPTAHLPLPATPPPPLSIPQAIVDKFNAWKSLQAIPYRYLVPDACLLPNESIRFFQLDNNWVNAFICGAFSIGHTVAADLSGYLTQLLQTGTVSGFMINSMVVNAWPGFEVDALTSTGTSTPLLRKDLLDRNIQLQLFDGLFSTLKFHLHPAKSHFGFLYESGDFLKPNYFGTAAPPVPLTIVSGTSYMPTTPGSNNVIAIPELVTNLNSTGIADFASKMIDGTPTVIYTA